MGKRNERNVVKYKIAESIAYRKLENEVVVLNLKNGLYYVLNGTASKIWEWHLVNKKNIPKLISFFADDYQMDEKDTIKKDIEEQLDFWLKEKLIEVV